MKQLLLLKVGRDFISIARTIYGLRVKWKTSTKWKSFHISKYGKI